MSVRTGTSKATAQVQAWGMGSWAGTGRGHGRTPRSTTDKGNHTGQDRTGRRPRQHRAELELQSEAPSPRAHASLTKTVATELAAQKGKLVLLGPGLTEGPE